MDREEFQIKADEMKALVGEKKYKEAMEIVDDIEWKRVKNVRSLCMAGEILAANKRYEDSRNLFLMAYRKSPTGKTILYRLVEISLKLDNISDAEKYYKDYVRIAPNDSSCSVLKYKIDSAKDAPIDSLINILEEYKEKEYTERWTYELAKLYFKAGEKQKCIETCDDLALWFRDGKYVEKCEELKRRINSNLPFEDETEEQEPEKQKEPEVKRLEEEEISSGDIHFPDEEKKDDLSEDESDGRSLAETIESISRAVPIFHNEGEFHKKITDGIKNIFQSGKPEDEFEDDSSEDDNNQINGQINFSDIIPEVPNMDEQDIPPLESENFVAKDFEKQKLPESSFHVKEAKEDTEDTSGQDITFNLEDSILAAAQAQGIDLPEDEPEVPEVRPENEIVSDDLPGEENSVESEESAEGITDQDSAETEKSEDIPEIIEEPAQEEETDEAEDISSANSEGDIVSEEIEKEDVPEETVKEESSEEPEFSENPEAPEETAAAEEPMKQLSEEEELMRFIDEQNRDPNIEDTDIVPREEELDDDEIKLFKYFSLVPGMKEQIAAALKDAQLSAADKTSTDGNIILMGNKGCGKTTLADLLIKAICRELKIPAAKIAKVKAGQLKDQDIAKIVDTLSGGFLLIQDVNQLDADSVNTLNQAMEFRTDGLTVLLEDEKIGMRKFIARNPKFINKFTSTISVPVFTNDELVNFAKVYTKEQGYVIDNMAILALYTLISDNQKEDEPMTVSGVKMIVDNAIAKEQSGIRKLQRNLSRNRTDRDGFVILYEKDFK